jgi:hypothetical protein
LDARHPENELPGHLMPGDVLLFHRHGYISWAIRRFDESDVDHAAIVLDPERMAEAAASGLRHAEIQPAVDGATFAYVLRLRRGGDALRAVEVARAAVAAHPPDTHERLAQLAVLAMTRRLPIAEPSLRRLLCVLLDRAADAVARLSDRGRRLTTDSEFVHRCFGSTGDPELAIAALSSPVHKTSDAQASNVSAEATLWEWAAGREDVATVPPRWPTVELEPLISAFARVDSPDDPIVSGCSASEDQMVDAVGDVTDGQLHAAAVRFRDCFVHLAASSSPPEGDPHPHPWSTFRAVANLVTPGDLRYSPSLRTVTSLRPSTRAAASGPSTPRSPGPDGGTGTGYGRGGSEGDQDSTGDEPLGAREPGPLP